MYKLFIILAGFCFLTPSQAQISEMMGFRDYRDISDAYFMRFKENSKFDINDIEGSPFLTEDFQFGYIIDSKSKNKAQAYLRYDVYNDVFEIKLEPNSKSLKTLKRTPRYKYNLGGETFVLIKSPQVINEEHYNSGNGYVVELTSPKAEAVLYKRYFKELIPGSKALTSYQQDIPPSIKSDTRYIIKFGDTYVRAEDHKKKILDAFSDHKKDIKNYIKDKGFKFRGDDKEIQNQMIQVVRYYNSLKN
ncbi:hypothetical protein [Flavobacterium sp. CS20]|jgi:hypothetical protein|uniref:hypothetical protein n=1 Tax=Flavobacterium sp. CS20 TaxID=2775246 RepID=UPI001B3A3FDA|nr:hypothetical protein [Flavobacterium sp. CS20]QTY26187.1 hypothetical protein IGB25_09405 [Flavobacterium sp. CS20]